jgi:transcriptional regulator with XRE-family HTH domain
MATILDEATVALAARIRLERERRGWSQSDLATHSGVSKAGISKIERHEMSPTAALLVRIAAAFDLTLAGLLTRAETNGERVSRVANQPVWRDPETGYVRQQLFLHPAHPLEIVHITLPAHGRVTLPASSYAHIRQVVIVQSGQLSIREGTEHHILETGDALGFGIPAETTFENVTDEVCTYLVALARG